MKKIIGMILCIAMIFSLGTVMAEENITVLLDGEPLAFTDASPVLVNDRTMVPMRVIFEALGATIKWDGDAQRVEALFDDGTHILLYIGKTTAYKNGTPSKLDAEPFLQNDRTFVPLRFVAESSGAKVDWIGETSTVTIVPPWKVTDFIPFGEFMSIPSPAGANKNFNLLDYTRNGSEAVFKYEVTSVEPDDIVKYEQDLVSRGFEMVKGNQAAREKILYNGDYVIKTSITEEGGKLIYTVVLYADSTGDSIKAELAE